VVSHEPRTLLETVSLATSGLNSAKERTRLVTTRAAKPTSAVAATFARWRDWCTPVVAAPWAARHDRPHLRRSAGPNRSQLAGCGGPGRDPCPSTSLRPVSAVVRLGCVRSVQPIPVPGRQCGDHRLKNTGVHGRADVPVPEPLRSDDRRCQTDGMGSSSSSTSARHASVCLGSSAMTSVASSGFPSSVIATPYTLLALRKSLRNRSRCPSKLRGRTTGKRCLSQL
jgi:hypothetical protein